MVVFKGIMETRDSRDYLANYNIGMSGKLQNTIVKGCKDGIRILFNVSDRKSVV